MAIQTVYCSNSIFSEVIENYKTSSTYEKLFAILENYSDIVLDVDTDELNELKEDNPFYNYFIKRDVGDFVPYKVFFQNITDEDFTIYPNDVFLIDNDALNTQAIREKQGCLILNREEIGMIEDLHKPFGFDFKVPIAGLDRKNLYNSWEEMLKNVCLNPISAIVLTDSFIYKNKGDFDKYKTENLYSIIKNIIPKDLETDLQILIVIDNSESVISKDKADEVIEDLSVFIKAEIGIDSKVGIVTHLKNKAIHERAILTNHHYFYSDKGFNIWLDSNPKYETKGKIEWLYHSVSENSGTIRKVNHFDYLKVIRKQRDDNNQTESPIGFNAGDVNNRLLN